MPAETSPNKEVFDDLLRAELLWLRTALSKTEQRLLAPFWSPAASSSNPFPINQLCLSGEIALVLLRMKPCCTILHHRWKGMGSRWFHDLLQPWAVKHQLHKFGFEWELIPVDAAYYESQHGRVTFGNGAIFRDLQSTHASLVNNVFHRTQYGVNMEELRLCFGYPSSVEKVLQGSWPNQQAMVIPSREATTSQEAVQSSCSSDGCSKIYYQFQHPDIIFASCKDEICSPCLEYDAHSNDAASVGRHFRHCREALLRYDISIALDMDQQEKWSNEDILETWWAASGEAVDCWVDLVNKDVLWNRLPLEGRFEEIRQLIARK